MSNKREFTWLSISEILAIHEQLLSLFGGSTGVRDFGLLESALARPQTLQAYDPNADIFLIAATYADGIVNNHPFIDGNKRTGFLSAAVFIETNGLKVSMSEVEVVSMTVGLADKSISREVYAEWLRNNSS